MVDFGTVVANSKTIAREISLINHGSETGEFKIKYSGDKPIAIMPTSGSVPPKSVQLIKVYSKTYVKWPLSKRPKISFQDQVLLNAGQSIADNAPWGAFCNTFDLH